MKDFSEYEKLFKQVHTELELGQRKFISLNSEIKRKINILENIAEKDFFILKGQMLYIEKMGEYFSDEIQKKKNAKLKVIFENGTYHEELLLNSLAAEFSRSDGYRITKRIDEELQQRLIIDEEIIQTGIIYVLKSLSENSQIKAIPNFYKIGVTTGDVRKRIANAKNEPTYLYADVEIIEEFIVENFSAKKLEKALHSLLADRQVDIKIQGINGKMVSPKEWFSIPFSEIPKIIDKIIEKISY